METISSLHFWLSVFGFIVVCFVVFIVPGWMIIDRLKFKLKPLTKFVLAVSLGLTIWGIQAYILGFMGHREISYVYVACLLLATILRGGRIKKAAGRFKTVWSKLDKFAVGIIFLGVLIQVLQMMGSGLLGKNGMGFFRVHSQDGIYHMSMISSMVRNFPPREPGAAGILVTNYHYWSDLIVAELARLFGFPIQMLYFQLIPFFISLVTALCVVALVDFWKGSKWFLRFALFFLFFGADAGYVVSYLIHQIVSFQYPVIDNGATQFLNMPHVFAKFVFFSQLLSLQFWLKNQKLKWGFVTGLLTAVLFGFKIYFALFAVLGLSIIALLLIIGRKFSLFRQFLLVGAVTGFLSALVYLPPNSGSGGLSYYPLEWPKLMLSQGNLDWQAWRYKLAVAQITHQKVKVFLYEVQAIAVTLIAIHGTRLLGFLTTAKSIRKLGGLTIVYLLVPSLFFTYLGLYTLQVSGGFNVFNFFAMSLSALAIVAAYNLSVWWENKHLMAKLMVVIIILFTIPRIFFETHKILTSYIKQSDVVFVSRDEIAGLKFIDDHFPSTCVIATSPENALDMKTPYVSFFSNRQAFMSGQSVLETHNAPTTQRYKNYRELFGGQDAGKIVAGLKENGVCALYLKTTDTLSGNQSLSDKIVFANREAIVLDLQ